jgi:adenylate cyclase
MLKQQARLENLIQEKFNKVLVVMFTDLKGSTSITETDGDLATHMLIKEHNDIVNTAIRENNGVLVKFIGDGTMSYFEKAQDALRAATAIQRGIDALNMSKKFKSLVLVRIGIHSGPCLLEDGDLFGDTINTASRFESSANAGEILLSSEAYNTLSDKAEIYCRFDRTITLKGKKDARDAYRAYWNPEEIEQNKAEVAQQKTADTPTSWVKISIFIAAALTLVLILSLWNPMMKLLKNQPETRTLEHTITNSE